MPIHPSPTPPLVDHWRTSLGTVLVTFSVLAGCAVEAPSSGDLAAEEPTTQKSAAFTSHQEVVNLCNQDPRVWSGLVPLNVCVGARLFFDETFDGNGRTCGSCHPVENNFTIDGPFLEGLESTDPLFINENPNFPLSTLETSQLREKGLILENLDGFDDLERKFVLRAVPHLFGLSQTLERDPEDGTSASFVERTGWSGDGVDGGSLRDFANGAIRQHFPKDLSRTPGVSFRNATNPELDALLAYQLSLGRRNELDLESVRIGDSFAEQGRLDFLDPQVGRCNECHRNAGATSVETGKNTNFASGNELFAADLLDVRPQIDGVSIFDGGFGGQGLAAPNIAAQPGPELNAFGDGSFNTPSLVEVADTAPFFHHNNLGTHSSPTSGLPAAVSFYGDDDFNDSPAGQELVQKFGTRVTLPGASIVTIASFLRVLNVAFNLDLAKQRLDASKLLNTQYWDYRKDVQLGLLRLAGEELAHAIAVLAATDGPPLHPEAQEPLARALAKIGEARATGNAATRIQRTQEALSLVAQVRGSLGTNLTFDLGPGTLMF